jgi:hypothetical protein
LKLHAIFFSTLLVLLALRAAAIDSAVTWQLWEHSFTSEKQYDDPYRQVSLQVTFHGPGDASFSSYGFWEKGDVFRIRAAFPSAGAWTWETSCSDRENKSLHHRKGKVIVSSYAGTNPLYKKGFLKVSADRRTLAYADDTPFLWMGDTGWYIFVKSTPDEWKKYVDNRAEKEFTILQVLVSGSRTTLQDADGQMAFNNEQPNDVFWKSLEKKVHYANEKGLVVFLVGLGAGGKGAYLPAMNTAEFARYLTGRLAGSFVVFSPSMDAHYDVRNDEVGLHLKEADPRHLVTQHVGTDLQAAEKYHPKEYLDFTCIQSGHHSGRVGEAYDAARAWSSTLYVQPPAKPVINAEGMYDGHGNDKGFHWREMDVRKIGWLSWLSGALGYTYGAGENKHSDIQDNGGVWLFNTDTATFDYWEKAMNWNSAGQMTLMKRFFESVEWWGLRPAPELIKSPEDDPLKIMAAAKNENGDLVIAYLPDNEAISLDLSHVATGLRARWFNPVTGMCTTAHGTGSNGKKTFVTPGKGDWVLLLN